MRLLNLSLKLNLSLCLVAALASLVPVHVRAQMQLESTGPAVAAKVASGAAFGKPVSADALARSRGGTEVVINDMTLNGTTAGNTADHVATGNNSISAGSFSNLSGISLNVQNSGANVLIQNAVILNVKMN